jgi:hypothetical protein
MSVVFAVNGAGGIIAAMVNVLGLAILLWLGTGIAAGAAESPALDVRVVDGGGVRATATILFPVEPAIIQRLLTDYPHWPDLFEVRMRVVGLTELTDGGVLTDIRIDHTLLPGERRLLCQSRTVEGGGLLTELKGGDFKQYRRIWTLRPLQGGTQTQADFELMVEIDSLVPDWMIAVAMKRELDAHFRIVRDKAIAQARQQPVNSER